MTEILLFPRLHQLGVRRVLMDPDRLCAGTLGSRLGGLDAYISYGASGGTRVSVDQLEELRNDLLRIGAAHGHPNKGTASARSAFDVACASWLFEHGPIRGGEALRDDVWAFVACCLAPELIIWRFGGGNPDRLRGGVRNTFQRLWLRAFALDRGAGAQDRWQLVERLPEDAVVQIIERPAIGSEQALARAIGEAWVATADRTGIASLEEITRAVVRRIRIVNETVCFSALEQDQLVNLFKSYFDESIEQRQPAVAARNKPGGLLRRFRR